MSAVIAGYFGACSRRDAVDAGQMIVMSLGYCRQRRWIATHFLFRPEWCWPRPTDRRPGDHPLQGFGTYADPPRVARDSNFRLPAHTPHARTLPLQPLGIGLCLAMQSENRDNSASCGGAAPATSAETSARRAVRDQDQAATFRCSRARMARQISDCSAKRAIRAANGREATACSAARLCERIDWMAPGRRPLGDDLPEDVRCRSDRTVTPRRVRRSITADRDGLADNWPRQARQMPLGRSRPARPRRSRMALRSFLALRRTLRSSTPAAAGFERGQAVMIKAAHKQGRNGEWVSITDAPVARRDAAASPAGAGRARIRAPTAAHRHAPGRRQPVST